MAARFRGIPQKGTTLGRPGATVTLVEFADLKCPVCQQFTLQTFPTLVQRYVRTGKLRIEFRPQTFVGSPARDSAKAARFALAARKRNRFWQLADLLYINQQDESVGYETDAFLSRIARADRVSTCPVFSRIATAPTSSTR